MATMFAVEKIICIIGWIIKNIGQAQITPGISRMAGRSIRIIMND
tara:strand:- start:211 stop:345 length:135 start_codon:yes stop_codon:yes gene_type:complete